MKEILETIKKISPIDENTVLAAKDHLVLIEKAGDKKILEKFSGAV